MKRLVALLPVLVAIVFPFLSVQACGPFFFDDLFVHKIRPDHPKDFAAGKLGVLLPSYPRADLAVAYRYLNGGVLTSDEQQAYKPSQSLLEYERPDTPYEARLTRAPNGDYYAEPLGPADEWLTARNHYAAPQAEIHAVRQDSSVYPEGFFLAGSYENCQPDGFHTAIATLQSRAKSWGDKSPELADWIKGQDAVFSNCPGTAPITDWLKDKPDIHATVPAPAPSTAPPLLRQDRAYQLAAAQFYAGQLDTSRASFQAIAQDQSSPWRGIAAYLVARTLVRQAFLSVPPNDDQPMAAFNPDQMKQAQQQLEAIRKQNLPGISPHAIGELLNLVRFRTEPEARLRELSAAVAGPAVDPYYTQDLNDLAWYLNSKLDGLPIRANADDELFHVERQQNDYRVLDAAEKQPGFDKTFDDIADLRSTSPLIDWLITFQSPAAAATRHALEEWKQTHSIPWLLAALQKAAPADPDAQALIEAAGRIPSTSPAWLTATYHRDRLLLGTRHITIAGTDTEGPKAAATETSALMDVVEKQGGESAANLFQGLRMRSAASLDDALADAPRRIIERVSQQQGALDECLDVMKNPKRVYDCKDPKSSVEFSDDAADLFNNEMPLAQLAQAAQSKSLPQALRQSVAIITWTRAVLLRNEPIAAQMLPLLPEKLRQQAGPGVGFHPLVALVRNPGLRPFLDPGVQRSYSYDFVESYEDNWWCADWTTDYSDRRDQPADVVSAAFLTPHMRDVAESETKKLSAMGAAKDYLGAQILDYAKQHPADPDIPETLYLTLRMIRYSCSHELRGETPHASTTRNIAEEAVALMRRRYITSPWTKKAAPFVWLGDPKSN